jgi:hypothetical protein
MLDAEALAITKSLAEGVKTYDQVVEVSNVDLNPLPVINFDSALL